MSEYLSPDWHAERRGYIGASEFAAAAGVSIYKTRAQLAKEKLGLEDPEDLSDNDACNAGHAIEPVITRRICERAEVDGVYLEPNSQTFVMTMPKPYKLHLGATPDCMGSKENCFAVGEAKLANSRDAGAWLDWSNGERPDSGKLLGYWLQVQHQMYVVGAELCYVGYYLDGSVNVFTVERDCAFDTLLRLWVEDFLIDPGKFVGSAWDELPPSADRIRSAKGSGEPPVELDSIEARAAMRDYCGARSMENEARERKNAAKEKLQLLAGGATRVVVDGIKAGWVSKDRAPTGKTVKDEYPDLYKECQSKIFSIAKFRTRHPDLYKSLVSSSKYFTVFRGGG